MHDPHDSRNQPSVIVATDAAIETIVERVLRRVFGELLARQPAAPSAVEWLTPEDAAKVARCDRRTLSRNGCPAHGRGRLKRYQRGEVEAWLAGRR